MTLDEFIMEYSGAPFNTEEFATKVVRFLPSENNLSLLACAYLDAMDEFEEALRCAGVEKG